MRRVRRVYNGAIGILFNLQGLLHLLQLPVLQLADPSRDGAVVADGVLEPIAHHGPLPHRRKSQQFLENGGKGRHPVVVIGVDDGKGFLHQVPGA